MDVDLNKFLEETSATSVHVAKENASEDDENVSESRRLVSSVFVSFFLFFLRNVLDDVSPTVAYVQRNKEIRLSI